MRNLPPRAYIDLSTCVNRYGPPPAALAALRSIAPDDLRLHPYGAEAELVGAYAKLFNVDPKDLLPARGTTGFIRALSRALPHADVALPLPAYTDFIRAFPGRGSFFTEAGVRVTPHLAQIAAAMATSKVVLIANPNNPCGTYLLAEDLIEICRKNPDRILVVDESYIDFIAPNTGRSLIGAPVENMLVLQSPSKFYGIAATRTGIAWTRSARIKVLLRELADPWPLSLPDVKTALAALRDTAWAEQSRAQLIEDGLWLDRLLQNYVRVEAAAAHYRFFFSPEAAAIRAALLEAGIIVRALGAAHGVPHGAVRMSAPKRDERETVGAALDAVLAKRDMRTTA